MVFKWGLYFTSLPTWTRLLSVVLARASAENLPGGRATEKRPKISKKYRKIALFSLFQGGGGGGGKGKKKQKKKKKAQKKPF